jgi:hypothetical protein
LLFVGSRLTRLPCSWRTPRGGTTTDTPRRRAPPPLLLIIRRRMRPAAATRAAGRDGGGRGSPTARHSAPDQLRFVLLLPPFFLPSLARRRLTNVTSEWIKATTASSPEDETNDAMELRSINQASVGYQHYYRTPKKNRGQFTDRSWGQQAPPTTAVLCCASPSLSSPSNPAYYILLFYSLTSHDNIPYQQQDDGSPSITHRQSLPISYIQ